MTTARRELDSHRPASVHPRRDGSGFEGVAEIQRSRLLAAIAELAAERGAANVTVAHVVQRAGVSRRTFYELFRDRQTCFLAAFDEAIARVSGRVLPAYESSGRWRERIRASLGELLSFLDDAPTMGRLLTVESLGAGGRALERRSSAMDWAIGAVDAGRKEAKAGLHLTPLTAEGVVGGVLWVLHKRMLDGEEQLVELTNPLMAMIVLPYLGPTAARGELSRPIAVRSPNGNHRAHVDPLRGIDMRLTYRTMRVLVAIAEHPGASNRSIGDTAGMSDQGQISKLLARLERVGLLENRRPDGAARGGPNAWALTQRGHEVHEVIRRQS
jgi:AcrR family transcriptional regulator